MPWIQCPLHTVSLSSPEVKDKHFIQSRTFHVFRKRNHEQQSCFCNPQHLELLNTAMGEGDHFLRAWCSPGTGVAPQVA